MSLFFSYLNQSEVVQDLVAPDLGQGVQHRLDGAHGGVGLLLLPVRGGVGFQEIVDVREEKVLLLKDLIHKHPFVRGNFRAYHLPG